MTIRLTPLRAPQQTRRAEPITVGVPLPKALCNDPARLILEDRAEMPQPLQVSVLERWNDKSLRWVLVDTQLNTSPHDPLEWRLRVAGSPTVQSVKHRIELLRHATGCSVRTGPATFEVRIGGAFPIDNAALRSGSLFAPARAELAASTDDGRSSAIIEAVVPELDGILRTIVLIRGRFEGHGASTSLCFSSRLHFFAGSATVRVELTIHNPRRARHTHNQWPLGDQGSVLLRSLELSLGFPVAEASCSVHPGRPPEPCALPFELYQDSSGGERWDSPVHRNHLGVVPARFRGFRTLAAGQEHRGLRASPVVIARTGEASTTVGLPDFWQNCPRSLRVATDAIVIGLFPRQYADVHELQGGEQKTHEIFLAFDDDAVSDPPLAWCHEPLRLGCDPPWYADAGALPGLTPAERDRSTGYRSLARLAVEGPDPFVAKRERIDEYGWRHFGDLYADHEAVSHTGPNPLVSHYNNQYDALAGFATQFFRDRDERWWTLMNDLARHVVDIDVYRTTEDKPAYNHGLFWHTDHYRDAGTSTHRAYPRGGPSAGGPSAEHNYTTGLMLHHFLTGSEQSRATAIALADWVLAMDDGARTVFRLLAQGATGVASSTYSPDYHGPGRGAGNSIVACLNAFRLTGERRYLDKAEQLICRCIHPLDDPSAHDLLDAERRWSYTVFLQALGAYLFEKQARDEVDAEYAYARASLLRYARWMVAAEYPYLDRRKTLEYPNETWAAQDMRKSEVFDFAALHSTGADRREYLERAIFFFNYSVDALTSAPTAVLTRPAVIMLTCGWRHAWVDQQGDKLADPVPVPPIVFPGRVRFRAQRQIAVARARLLALVVAVALIAILMAWGMAR